MTPLHNVRAMVVRTERFAPLVTGRPRNASLVDNADLIESMITWVRLQTAGFVARRYASATGRPAECSPASFDGAALSWVKCEAPTLGNRSLWAFLSNDQADLPAPYNTSLVTPSS